MIQVALAEDDSKYSKLLIEYLHRFETEYHVQFEIAVFADGARLMEDFRKQYDLILLDIEMPIMDGMTTAQKIRELDSDVMILFITNMAQYAIRGYEVDAMDYILKPLNYFFFSQRLNRAIGRLAKKTTRYLFLPLKGGKKKLSAEDIYYVESQAHNLIFHTKEGDFTITGSMKDIEEKLQDLPFSRCNKGYLVALAHVDGVEEGCAVVQGHRLLISRGRKKEFMEELTNFIGGINP